MSQALIIVESPTKAKTLARYLGKNYRIEATMGHIRDLPERKLGIEIKQITNNKKQKTESYKFIPDYQLIPGRRQKITELKKIAGGTTTVILATDPDREGEAIAYHVYHVISSNEKLKIKNEKYKRIVFHEITQSAIKHALENPREIDLKLVDAQQGRRILDRLVGYKLSPLLWVKMGKRWLSAGRVQSVAVRLIVEREREIEAFKAEEYWLIDAELNKSDKRKQITDDREQRIFLARLVKIGKEKAEIKNKEVADRIISDLEKADYRVINIEVKELYRFPPPPFTTSTLQQIAVSKFGWTAKRTMRTAQNLYEEGYITYHRTDSTNLSAQALSMVRGYIEDVYGNEYLPQSALLYKTKSKVAQEAHEAVRPTNVKILGDYDIRRLEKNNIHQKDIRKLEVSLGKDADLLYSLIWKRFVACQMKEMRIEQTTIIISGRICTKDYPAGHEIEYTLKSVGDRVKFKGWTVLYNEEKNSCLPPLEKEEDLALIRILPQQKFTEPPARYTEATLIKVLEERGIGRPSTYAPIITTIQDRKYAEKIEKKFRPTDLGKSVNDFLVKYFPDIFDIGFTARMEDELDAIATGEMQWEKVISDFYNPFNTTLVKVFKEAQRVKIDLGITNEKCPKCSGTLAVRLSKFGKFLACSNYPKCTFTKNMTEKAGITCPRCGGDIVVKKTRRGKQFYGCGNYPKCTYAAWKKEDIKNDPLTLSTNQPITQLTNL